MEPTEVKQEEVKVEKVETAINQEDSSTEEKHQNGGAEPKEKNGDKQENGNGEANEENSNGVTPDEKPTGRKSNIVSDPSLLPESNDPSEIRKQVEFYFSDANLPFDKFLFSMVGFENKWVPLKLVASFKRMKRFTDFTAIQNALSESEFLELNPPKNQVRRKVPLMKAVDRKIQQVVDRALLSSIYAKGFGDETPTSQFDIEKFFEPYGPLNAVRLRRTPEKTFKGSVFVEFKDVETMKKFMALEVKPKYNSSELIYMTKKDYVDMKMKDIQEGRLEPSVREKHKRKFNAFKHATPHRNQRKGDEGVENDGEEGDGKQKSGRGQRKQQGGRTGKGGRRGGRGGHGGRSNRGARGGSRNNERGAPKPADAAAPTVKATADTAQQGTKRPREEGDNEPLPDKKVKTEEGDNEPLTDKKVKTEEGDNEPLTDKKVKTEEAET